MQAVGCLKLPFRKLPYIQWLRQRDASQEEMQWHRTQATFDGLMLSRTDYTRRKRSAWTPHLNFSWACLRTSLSKCDLLCQRITLQRSLNEKFMSNNEKSEESDGIWIKRGLYLRKRSNRHKKCRVWMSLQVKVIYLSTNKNQWQVWHALWAMNLPNMGKEMVHWDQSKVL